MPLKYRPHIPLWMNEWMHDWIGENYNGLQCRQKVKEKDDDGDKMYN